MSYGLCASAVPLFFLISGFLYFKGCESQFGLKDYMAKNRKRLRTLLIPYLLWNIFTLLLFGAVLDASHDVGQAYTNSGLFVKRLAYGFLECR